jgi:hypothetical protein
MYLKLEMGRALGEGQRGLSLRAGFAMRKVDGGVINPRRTLS